MRFLGFIGILLIFSPVAFSQSSDQLQGRMNTMECSEQEVLAYVIPKDEGRLSPNYETYKAAHAQTAIYSQAAEGVETCLGVLYGDMGELTEQLSAATSAMFSGITTDGLMDQLLTQAFDELTSSVCGALEAGVALAHTEVVDNVNQLHELVLDEVDDLIGQRALAGYVDDYLVDQDPMGLELRYRQKGISNEMVTDQLDGTLKTRWKRRLRELNKELPN